MRPVVGGMTGRGVGESLSGSDASASACNTRRSRSRCVAVCAPYLLDRSTTNAAESLIRRTRHVKRNVKRWRGGKMMVRWVAAGVLEAVKGFRRLKGRKAMPELVAALVVVISSSGSSWMWRTSRRRQLSRRWNFNSRRDIALLSIT